MDPTSSLDLSWITQGNLFWFALDDNIWKVREKFREGYTLGQVVYGFVKSGESILYLCAESLAEAGNFFGLNLGRLFLRKISRKKTF